MKMVEVLLKARENLSNGHKIKKKEKAPSISKIIMRFSENGCVNKIHRTGRGKDVIVAEKLNDSY